jgi:hypothetical protein
MFIIGNRKNVDQWNDNIVDTQKGMNFRNKNQPSNGTKYPWKYT